MSTNEGQTMNPLTKANLDGNLFGRDVNMFQLGKEMTTAIHDLNRLGIHVHVVQDSGGSLRIVHAWRDGDTAGLPEAMLRAREVKR